jgi:hypothetical protein
VQPGDELAGGPQHGRHQQVDLAVLGGGRRQQRGGGVAHLLGRAQAQAHQAPLGLVGDGVAAQLERHGEAELDRGGHRGAGVGHDTLRRERHTEGAEQLLGACFREGGHGASG